MLADVVLRKGVSAGSLDGWEWRELKALPVSWFDELARILTKVEDLGVWPDGLLDAYIAMIPKTDGDATPLGQRPLCVLPVVYRIWAAARMGQLEGWFKSWVPDSVFSAGGGRGSVEAWYTSALDIEEVLSGATDPHVHLFVADVVKSFDTVDRGILDRVLSSLGLPGWFRHAYFEYHAHVRLRFKLASGLGQSWTRDGGIPQGFPLSMMFIVALYLPWCRYLSAQVGVRPQLYDDNLKCLSGNPDLLMHAARFTTEYVRLVGQEPAPSKCVLLSTSRKVRKDMKDWVLSLEGDHWSVKFDVRDLGGHLDTTFRGWSSTLAARVRLVISRLVLVFVLPLDFHGRVRVVRSMYLPAALHGIEASLLVSGSLRKLRSAVCRVVWSRRQPLASVGAVLSLLDGPAGCDPAFCVVWFRFRLLRRYLALWPAEVHRVYRLLEMVGDGCPGHGPIHLLSASAAEIGFLWDPHTLAWVRPGLPLLSNLAGPIQHFRAAILDAWRDKVAADLCKRKGFRGGPLLDVHGSLQLLNSSHVRERDKALLCLLPGGLRGFVPCSIGANHCRHRHIGWEKCGHGLTSRPRESASELFLDELLSLFRYPSRSGRALLNGTLPLRYCAVRFAHSTPTWRLPGSGQVCRLVAAYPDSAGNCSGEVFAFRVPLVSKSNPVRKRFRLNRKTPAHLVGVLTHSRPRVWKRLRQVGFSDLSMPDHTRRRCDHAVWDSVYEHDRVGVG